jgi:hypothetical protein
VVEWSPIIREVLSLPPHVDIVVPKIPLPKEARRTLGEFRGQVADWEIKLEDGRRIHIVEFEDCYKVHWDLVSPHENPIGHLRKDAKHWYDLLLDVLTMLRSRFQKPF